uniref:Palmitoyltransferase n=1 Tax=Amazona collaria TaxID=241587 RepID=A0A8B9GSA2_9PSIT
PIYCASSPGCHQNTLFALFTQFRSRSIQRLAKSVGYNQLQTPVNGWSWPLHIFQITGWLLCLFFALVGFGILVPLLPRHWLPAGYIVSFGVCFIYHLVVHLTAVSIDPADANVRAKNYLGPLATFNRNQHAHVIENHHCHVCDVNVSAKSKHCGTCNKCVCGFDHHCKWLNNCVGERNYRLFLNSVLSAILGLGLLLLIACYVFAEFFIDPMVLRSDHPLKNQTDRWFVFLPAAPVETQAPAILITTGIFILLSLMTVVLLGHLLIFHIYLSSCFSFCIHCVFTHLTNTHILCRIATEKVENLVVPKLGKKGCGGREMRTVVTEHPWLDFG